MSPSENELEARVGRLCGDCGGWFYQSPDAAPVAFCASCATVQDRRRTPPNLLLRLLCRWSSRTAEMLG